MSDLLALPIMNIKVIASFEMRALAYLIDVIVFFFLILTPFSSIYYELSGINIENLTINQSLNSPVIFNILMIGYFACILIFVFYLSSFEYLLGATLGKKMLGLSVISKSKKLSLMQAIIRNLTKTVFINALAFDCFLLIFDREKRRVSDFISNTLVISNRKIIKKFGAVNELWMIL